MFKNWQSPFFHPGKLIFAKIWAKRAQNSPKKGFFGFLKNFVMSVFLGNNLKRKLTLLWIFPHNIRQKFWVSGYGPKCCQPINLQDSLNSNILQKKWMMKFVFCMQINIEVFYKVILSFWVSVTRHAQSTQNKFHIFAISP